MPPVYRQSAVIYTDHSLRLRLCIAQ